VGDSYRVLDGSEPYFTISKGESIRVDFLTPHGDQGQVEAVALYDRDESTISEIYKLEELTDQPYF